MGTARPGGQRAWTPEEDAQVVRLYPEHGAVWPGWSTHGVHRTPKAIRGRAAMLGVRIRPGGTAYKPRWTEREDRQLRMVLQVASDRTGRTKAAVAARMRELAARDMERGDGTNDEEDR